MALRNIGLTLCLFALGFSSSRSMAFPDNLIQWEARYASTRQSSLNANCQLCHLSPAGGNPWNAYGWDIRAALRDPACGAIGPDGLVSKADAFACVEQKNSDGDPEGKSNLDEIRAGSQPGWTPGARNTIWTLVGQRDEKQIPPEGIGPLDPGGRELVTAVPPPSWARERARPSMGSSGRSIVLVRTGESIQAAIDAAEPGTTILIEPGVYREMGNADGTNALEIAKSHLRLIGLSGPLKLGRSRDATARADEAETVRPPKGNAAEESPGRVVLRNAGGQRNGIVVVPHERTECMDCHSSLAPPFPRLPGVPPITDTDPVLFDVEISGITIEGFPNNGLFTERLDGFRIVDVRSVNNRNYGIFPTLSRNGIVTQSVATGSDDSGMWVETSDNVQVTHNLMENNVNGLEVSNSDDIYVAYNEMRGNTVGIAAFVLQDALFAIRPDGNRYTIRRNWVHDNNKPNTATGGILATAMPGTGILALAMDESRFVENRIENHDAFGLVLADSCVVLAGSDYDCETSPVPEGFAGPLGSNIIENNRVIGNLFVNNGSRPPAGPFGPLAGDIVFGSTGTATSNCFADNVYRRFTDMVSPHGTDVARPAPLAAAPCQ